MRRILLTTTAIASAIVIPLAFTACSSDSSGSSPGNVADGGAAGDTGTVDSSPTTGGDAGPDAPATPTVSCATFCAAVVKNCTGANQQYTSEDECNVICQDFGVGTYGDSDNTLGCRQAHADLAAQNPGKECLSAGPFGADVCAGRS